MHSPKPGSGGAQAKDAWTASTRGIVGRVIWLDELEAHLASERWEAALRLALAHWITWRQPVLADVVDALSVKAAAIVVEARRAKQEPDTYSYHEWFDRAVAYDVLEASQQLAAIQHTEGQRGRSELPAEAAARRAMLEQQLQYASRDVHTWRIVYTTTWPPDPRVTWHVIDWLERLAIDWPRPRLHGNKAKEAALAWLLRTISTYLKELADVRARERLHALLEYPPGHSSGLRQALRQIATSALEGLDGLPAVELGEDTRVRLEALVDRVGRVERPGPQPPPSFAPADLWLQVGQAPDDDGPRMVLADALIERDDPRGQLLAHQLRQPAQYSVHLDKLIRKHWQVWLGKDVANLLLQGRSTYHRGMLHAITVGPGSLPPWRRDAAIGHRELVAVRIVRPKHAAPADYARLVASLPNVHTIGVESAAMASALAEYGPFPAVTALEVHRRERTDTVVDSLRPIAASTPSVTHLQLFRAPSVEELAELRQMFGKLESLLLDRGAHVPSYHEVYEAPADLRVKWRYLRP